MDNQNPQLPSFLQSSVDPSKLSMTASGAFLLSATVIIALANKMGIAVDGDATQLATTLGAAVSALMVLVGLLRKLVMRFHR